MPPIFESRAPKLTLVGSLLCLSTVSHARQTGSSGEVHRITLPEAQARAAANGKVRAAELAATAASHHLEAEADLAQAEWKYRVARQQLHKLVGMH